MRYLVITELLKLPKPILRKPCQNVPDYCHRQLKNESRLLLSLLSYRPFIQDVHGDCQPSTLPQRTFRSSRTPSDQRPCIRAHGSRSSARRLATRCRRSRGLSMNRPCPKHIVFVSATTSRRRALSSATSTSPWFRWKTVETTGAQPTTESARFFTRPESTCQVRWQRGYFLYLN